MCQILQFNRKNVDLVVSDLKMCRTRRSRYTGEKPYISMGQLPIIDDIRNLLILRFGTTLNPQWWTILLLNTIMDLT